MGYDSGGYYRQFTLGELINQQVIDAKLNDGVLRRSLFYQFLVVLRTSCMEAGAVNLLTLNR